MTALKSSDKERRAFTYRPLQSFSALIFIILAIRGQLYIASTFAGSRPALRAEISETTVLSPGVDSVWDQCAQILGEGLDNLGDAGRIWRQHAYVGTNLDPDDPSLHTPVKTLADFDKFKCRCETPDVHAGRKPKLTAILQSFNHHANIQNISTALKSSPIVQEIIVNEDGSTDGSVHDWRTVLNNDWHFIIRSNNLHELRSYNRAMRISSGDVIVLLQDDDLLPSNDEWLRNAVRLFKALPKLGILSGYIGQMWDHSTGQGYEYGEQKSTHGGKRSGDTKPLPYIEKETGLPFTYAECAWIAPLFIRRSLLEMAGGLELTIAKRGEPGVWQDCVLSYEAWVHGYSVGVYHAPFERGVGGHGSASSSAKLKQREKVFDRAVAYTNRKFPRRRIHDSIQLLCNQTLKVRS